MTTTAPKKRVMARRKDEPAFLQLGLSIGNSEPKLTFDWKDGSSQHTSDKYISFNPGMDYETAKVEYVANHDDRQKRRARDHNLAVIIALARLRILEWAREGTEGDHISPNPAYALQGLVEPVLALPPLIQISDQMARITESVRQRFNA
ncbi:hypothetical protein ACHAPJ_000409 [Fusarium lateritium]